jgi:D-galactarolactone cycloisomerase
LAAGEAAFSRFEFKRLLDEGTIDIFTPDVGKCGGLAEASFIANIATTGNVTVRPHVWMGAVGIAASLQFAATVPRYPHSVNVPDPFLFECDRAPNPFRDELVEESIDPTGGVLEIPDRPGLGVTPDLDAIDRYRID